MNNTILNIESNIGNGDIVRTENGSYYANDKKERLIYDNPAVETVTLKSDVSEDQRDVVNYVVSKGYMVGTDDKTFNPNGTLTRAQAVATLYAAAGRPKVNSHTNFSDVNGSNWYYDAVSWAQQNGIVAGNTDGTFRPNDPITNQQATAIMRKFAEYNGKDVTSHGSVQNYQDASSVSDWAKDAMSWALENNMYDSYFGNLNPKNTMTRYGFANMLANYDVNYNGATINTGNFNIAKIQDNIDNPSPVVETPDGSYYASDKEQKLIYTEPAATETVELEASDVSSSQREVVDYVKSKGYMVGVSDTKFDPNGNLTRAQAVMSLYKAAGSPEVQGANNFKDINSGDWYYKAVLWAKENGIVGGFDDGTFKPNDYLTNQQMTAILAKYAIYNGNDISSSGNISTYSDYLSVSNWAKDSMSWALENGIYKDDYGNINPNRKATRYDFASALKNYDEYNARVARYKIANIRDSIDDTIPGSDSIPSDVPSTKENKEVEVLNNSKEAIDYVRSRNLMNNLTNDDFGENSEITRAQLIQTLYALSGRPYTGINNTFSDVNNNTWYYDAVTWAQNVGLISGYTDGTFRPNEKVSASQMNAIMNSYARLAGGNYSASSYAGNIKRIELAQTLMDYDRLNNNGSGRTTTIRRANTNNVKKTDDAAILKEIQSNYDSIPYKKNGNYAGYCGQLTCDQLARKGLINDSDRHSYGKDQARYIANKGATGTGHKVAGYEMSGSTSSGGYEQNCKVFEEMIANNNGSASNIVISFSAWDGHPYGHVCLVSKIENGNVYLIDNTSFTTSNGNRVATKLSIQDFENKYFHSFPACYMTQIY